MTAKEGMLSVDRAASIQALCDAGAAVQFSDGVNTFNVIFDYSKGSPVDLDFLDDNRAVMIGTIYLRKV